MKHIYVALAYAPCKLRGRLEKQFCSVLWGCIYFFCRLPCLYKTLLELFHRYLKSTLAHKSKYIKSKWGKITSHICIAKTTIFYTVPAFSAVAQWSPQHTSADLWCSPALFAVAPQWPLISSPATSPRCLYQRQGLSPRLGWSPGVWAGMTGASFLDTQQQIQI